MFLHILRIAPRPSRYLSLRSPSFLTKGPLRLGPPTSRNRPPRAAYQLYFEDTDILVIYWFSLYNPRMAEFMPELSWSA